MSKTLVIVESPAKSKTIGKFLGRKYVVKASMGHVRDLPKSQFGVDVEEDFKPKYITIRGKGDIIKDLKAAAKKATKILIATDPDREGEAIAWHLQHILHIDEQETCRIEFNEITKTAVGKAVKSPRKLDIHRVEAQQARRILDRLVGYNLSPLLWRKIRKGLSAGRVQSVAVRLITDREEEIEDFVPEEYWTLTAAVSKPNDKKVFEAKLVKYQGEKLEVKNQAQMDQVLAEIADQSFVVREVKKREKRRQPAPPFTTSSLQQEAYRKLNFPARKTMMIAQQLYEGLDLGDEGTVGLVTYIRTDSTRIADEALVEVRELISSKYGVNYIPEAARIFPTSRKAQDAHEAIRPTSVLRSPEEVKPLLSRDQSRLYKLIWDRFVACQMSPAILDTTGVDIAVGAYGFRATGSIIKFAGFMKLYIEGNDEEDAEGEKVLPELEANTVLDQHTINPKQHFTQPPARYTDASLIKILEELGIGRPSTYAPIVETIQKRGYVVKEEKQFFPTELGILVVDLLKEHFPKVIDVEFTAGLESELDHVEDGTEDWVQVLSQFYHPFKDTLAVADAAIGKVELEVEVTDEICPECGANLVVKFGRFGKFLACPKFPDCRYTKPLLESTGVNCPKCAGEMVVRRSKKGRKFYGCNHYPECDFVTWDAPTDKKCPTCGEMLVTKTTRQKGTVLKCNDRTCRYQEMVPESSEVQA